MKKYLILFLSVVLFAVSFTGCSSASKSAENSTAPQSASTASMEKNSSSAVYDAKDEYYGVEAEIEAPASEEMGGGAAVSGQKLMFIKSANINLRSDDFDNDLINIRTTVNNFGGYFESSNLYSSYSSGKPYKRYNATVRVPVENYDLAKDALENIGVLYMSNESAQEVSGEYFNIQSRLETAKSEEKRLLELIDETYDMEQLIRLEQRLGEVRTQIELYETQLRRIESLTSYSTIILDVTEVEPEELIVKDDGFFTRLSNGFKNSIDATVTFFQNVLVFLAYAIVPIAIILVLIFVAVYITKRTRKKDKLKEDREAYRDKEKESK